MFSEKIKNKVIEAYEKNMAAYPKKKEEVECFIRGKAWEEQLCIQYLYAFMTVNDIVSYEVEYIAHYVEASLEMLEHVSYALDVPEELFLTYVLPYRVNNEHIDDSRKMLYEHLLPRVSGKSMLKACLEVNYWCYERATYIPADDRTLSPSAMMKKAKGRCGEESTFTVSALRSVGIPARQCYSPRWAHCDDNHAWVEVWVDGCWHYMGACEPEPVLDKGWFTAAASKAMLVHSKAYANEESGLVSQAESAYSTPVYTLINSTSMYGAVQTLKVRVLENQMPKEHVLVQFQLINYSELYSIYEGYTDKEGMVTFTTGLGDLCIYIENNGKSILKKVDMRREWNITIDLKDAKEIEKWNDCVLDMDFIPPKEYVASSLREADWNLHEKRLAACEALRETIEAGFDQEQKGNIYTHYYMLAKGNKKEVASFLSCGNAEESEKMDLLSTLREKDFVDITCETLMDALNCAKPYQNHYPRDIYKNYILAPRIHNEMLMPVRSKIVQWLKEQKIKLNIGQQVWRYLKDRVHIISDYGAAIETANSFGALFYGMCDRASFPIVFVALCRSVGIPARLNPMTLEPEYGIWQRNTVVFLSPDKTKKEENETNSVTVTFVTENKKSAVYSTQFSLGVWKNGNYHTLQLYGMEVSGEKKVDLEPGEYRLITSVRQIDGSVSARISYFSLKEDRVLVLSMREDRTKEKIKRVQLSDVTVKYGETIGKVSDFWKEYPGLLIVADPGKEPTEHLFQELLEWKEKYKKQEIGIVILLKELSNNETLRKVERELPNTKIVQWMDEKEIYQLHRDMQVGDERLPFAVAIDKNGFGLYAFANYNIRTAQTMYHIIEIS